MKVLFVEDVPTVAYAGDIKEVKNGFARNYLLPKKMAVLATKDQMPRVERLRSGASKRREATETEMTGLAEKLKDVTVTIMARAGRNDRLYGSVTNAVVAQELSKLAGREIDRRKINLEPIRQLGTYQVSDKLHPGIEPRVTVVVAAPTQEAAPEPTAEEVVAALEKGEEIPGLEAGGPPPEASQETPEASHS